MKRYDPTTGKYIDKSFNFETGTFDIKELNEEEVNNLAGKPEFTSVPEEPPEDESFLTDVGRVGFSALEGIAQLGSDVLVRPFQEDKEVYDEAYSEWRGDMAEYVPGLEREDIIDVETGKVLRPETGGGMVLDIASYLVGGGVVFKALGKLSKLQKAKYGNITRGVIAEQTVEQTLADPDSNLFNFVAEDLMDDPPELIEFLAADEADDVLFNRAKMAVTSGLLTAGIGGLIRYGFKPSDITRHTKAVLGGKETPTTFEDYDKVVGSLLGATKEQLKNNPSPIITKVKEAAEDTAEGVAQIINQSSDGLSGAKSWVQQRYFSSRGFLSKEGQKAKETSIANQRRLISHAGHVANRLQRFMDNAIEENIVDDVSKALTDKTLLNLSPNEKIEYLTSTSMKSFLIKKYGFSDALASKFVRVSDKNKVLMGDKFKPNTVKFLEDNGFPTEVASEIATIKPYGFSNEIATEIADARGAIDTLSKTILDSNIGSEAVRESISANMGSYMRKSYRLYEDANWTPSDSTIQAAEDAIVAAKVGSKQDIDAEMLEEFRAQAKDYIGELLNKDDLVNYYDYLSKMKKVNVKFLKQRKEMLPELEKLMGKIESPTENIILTVQKAVSLTENHKFYNKLMELGGSVPSRPLVYDEALAQARIELRSAQVNFLDDTTETLQKGSYVTINNSEFGVPTGTVGRVVNIGTKKAPNRTYVQVGKSKKLLSFPTKENWQNLDVISNNQKVNKLAKQYYDDVTGGKAYTSTKYISDHLTDTFNVKIKGTGSALDGKYTTKDLVRSINNLEDTHTSLFGLGGSYFKEGIKNQGAFQLFIGAKGLQQQMRTVYDHTTHLRNGLGGLQFGVANGLNPLKNGRLNFQVLRNEIGEKGDKVYDELYEKLQGLGVINTSVRASESRALLDIASETVPSQWAARIEDYAKRQPDTRLGKAAKTAILAKKRPEQVYMATDDFFKMNGFFNELATLRKAHAGDASWTEELLELKAAELIKDTMPNYDRVALGIKALREMPVGNFVSFPAEIARTSANILTQAAKEIKSGNSVLRARGFQRLAGFSFSNLGWYAGGSLGYKALGFTEIENEGFQTNAEGYSLNHNKQILRGENGEMFVHEPTYIDSYNVWKDIGWAMHREFSVGEISGKALHEKMVGGVLESVKAFIQPFTDEAMFSELMGDLYYAAHDEQGRTSEGRKIFEDKENYGQSIIDAVGHASKALAPGFILDGKKYAEAIFETPNPSTGLKRSLTARTIEMLSGINFRKYKPEDNFMFHTKKYNRIVNYEIGRVLPRYGKEGEEYFKEYSIAQAKKYKASQELFRQIEAMRNIGFEDSKIYEFLGDAGLRGKEARKFLMQGKFRPDTLTGKRLGKIIEKADDKTKAKKNNKKLLSFYKYLRGLKLQPVEEEEVESSRIARDKISFKEFDRLEFTLGGEVTLKNPVPQVPDNPSERINKMTGEPYSDTAGFEDPLKLFGFAGGGQADPLARLGFSGGSVVNAITRHHIKNLKNKTYATNSRGQIQTVYTMQVNDPRLNDGMPTLIPSVYNKKVLSERDAIEEAVKSKINWPYAKTHPELRKKDIEIHRPFNQDLVDYGIIPKRTGKVLGSVVRTLAKQTAKQGKSKGGKVLGALSRATVNA